MRVLVTGGAGYIGSHTILTLLERGDDVIVVDNFANSSPVSLDRVAGITGRTPRLHRVDVADEPALDAVFAAEKPEAVIHFAGLKAVGESVAEPLRYYSENLGTTFALLAAMQRHEVHTLVFSSSATVYGDHQDAPYREDGGLLDAANPYGQTKVMLERVLTDVAQADPRWRIALLRYFNPIGAHESGLIGEDPRGVPNNLAPYVAQVAVGRLAEVGVFGDDYPTADGTGERDYIHVADLAEGHVAALEHLRTHEGVRAWNLGTGRATSVLELIGAFEKASGRPIPYRVLPRREGDLAQAWADTTRAEQELGWSARRGIAEMAEDAWRWQSRNPQGYDTE
ncbi:UDP-glucose 4-epimerase GalE [Microbacterium sp.]|uniref:UDP-glucose 4-epimerase GalE n=1 Tax=Microbacterium sp. TaxID=51671 RepID=UPI001AD1CEFD|nr:UDP-glucose 4-epimerase GalE [Microbacterium sp.]MBN9156324.1 UDP-glucose 4-epimerase GalE [Microbacterium sp.]MBS1899157.1 UDP-glucose 4-epimerase GalE [Actinomycetota bacterium]